MMKREKREKKAPARKDDVAETPSKSGKDKKNPEDLKREMDEILDEIDSVLEKNAEEFVKAYVQHGGE